MAGIVSGPVKVFPPQVTFEDARPNTLYVLTVFVQNVSQQASRIRLKHPKSDYFTLNYTPAEAVAPGLEVRAEVEFCIPEGLEQEEFHDKITVICNKHTYDIKLTGYAERPRIEIEGNGLVDFGTVVKGNTVTRYVELRNSGSKTGEFRVVGDLGPNVTVSPMQGRLSASSSGTMDNNKKSSGLITSRLSERLKIDYHATETGAFRNCINVEVNGQPIRVLDICATVVEQRLELVMPNQKGKVPSAMNFGKLYFGQTRTKSVLLVNNGPMACQYCVLFKGGDGFQLYQDTPRSDIDDSPMGIDDDNDELAGYLQEIGSNAPIRVSPSEGVLNPYSQIELTLIFAPTRPKQPKGFKNRGDMKLHDQVDFTLDAMISCSDTNQNVPINLTGRALKPQLAVSRKTFKFGSCPTNDRRDIMFTISNKGEELPVDFNINKVAFFSCKPNAGKLLPGQSQNVLITFCPTQMGEFRNTIHLVMNKGIAVVPLNVIGNCASIGDRKVIPGGPNARLADFKPDVKYVDDDEVKRLEREGPRENPFRRLPPWEKKKMALREQEYADLGSPYLKKDGAVGEQTSFIDDDDEMDDEIFGGVKSYDPTYTYSTSDLIRKQSHRDQYADFLKRAHDARQQRREEIKREQLKKKKKKKGERTRRKSRGFHDAEEDSSEDDEGFSEDTDIDLDPYGGLRSPRLDVPEEREPLWLERPMDHVVGVDGAGNGKNGRRRHRPKAHDEDKLLKRKFKPKPTTQAEMIDCVMQISSSDLVLISAAPKVIDFGVVSVNSRTSKCLGITNDLSQNILVEVQFEDHEELAQSLPASQVIPAGGMAGFDVTFLSTAQPPQGQSNRFKHTLTYIVNGHHKFKVTVLAEVIPIKIDLSHQVLNFRFADDNLGSETSETITLKNTGNARATFSWVQMMMNAQGGGPLSPNAGGGQVSSPTSAGALHSAFTAEPETGFLEPNESKEVTITFTPSSKAPKEQNLALRVRGGYDEILTCVGEIEEPACSFLERKLDFGFVPVGIPQNVTFSLRNSGHHSAAFIIDEDDLPVGIDVATKRGKIPPTSTIDIQVTFLAKEPMRLDASTHFLTVQLRGGKDLRLPLLCEAIVPEVELLEEKTDFEGVTIGSSAMKTLTFENKSNVPAIMKLDFAEHPEFEIALSEENLNDKEIGYTDDDLESLLRPVTAPQSGNGNGKSQKFSPFQTVDEFNLDAMGGDEDDLDEAVDPMNVTDAFNGLDDGECTLFELKVPKNKRLKVSVMFCPKQEKLHAFQLPMKLAGTKDVIKHIISGEGLRPKLLLSSTNVNFETKIVARDRVKKAPFFRDVTVTNHHSEGLRWEIDTKEIDKMEGGPFFSCKPTNGYLDPGETCVVKVGFLPRDEIQYSSFLPVYLDDDTSREYIRIALHGTGMYPKLRFSSPEVVLPTVPLGVRTRAMFTVQNDGYDNLELQAKLPPESQRIPLTISFPEGKNIGVGRPEVPVEVSFVSKRPLSFTAKVDFVDQDGNRFSIRVTGTTDNCLLTSFPFVAAVRDSFDYFPLNQEQATLSTQFLPMHEATKALKAADSASSLASESHAAATKKAAGSKPPATKKTNGKANSNIKKKMKKKPQQQPATDRGEHDDDDDDVKKTHGKPEGPFVADASLLIETASTSKDSLQSIIRFLNITAFEIPVNEFPGDFIASHGRQLLDLVENLSGKKVPGRVRNAQHLNKKKELPMQLVAQYGSMLKFLKARGGMLHEIRPEQFLAKEDFVRFREKQNAEQQQGEAGGFDGASSSCGLTTVMLNGSASGSTLSAAHGAALLRRHQFEREHADVSVKAWSACLLQVLKLFVLSRVTLKQFKSLPGVQLEPMRGNLLTKTLSSNSTCSNIYSVPEMLLLEWLSLHHRNGSNMILSSGGGGVPAADVIPPGEVNPFQTCDQVINFDADLSNGVVLCTTIAAHVPSLLLPGHALANIVLEPTDVSQCVTNLRAVMASLKELGLEYSKNPEDMLKEVANARDNLLFVLYLYQNLPQFVFKAVVEFNCSLGSKVTKAIELKNPSPKLIGYNITLDAPNNNRDFVVKDRSILIEPHGTTNLPIEFLSRFSKPVEATLMLKPDTNTGGGLDAEGKEKPSALVFKLVSNVHSRKSLKTIKCSARTYEMLNVDVVVTNPFNHDAKFVIQLVQEFECAPNPSRAAGDRRGTNKKGKGSSQPRGVGKPKKKIVDEASESKTSLSDILEASMESLPDGFSTKQTVLKMKATETASFKLQFLPFYPGEYKCQLVFLDDNVGEFLYEVVAEAGLPQALECIKMSAECKNVTTKTISVGSSNKFLDKARLSLPGDVKDFIGTSKMFNVFIDSPFFNADDKIIMDEHGEASINLEFVPSNAGVYPAQIVLKSPVQVRVIDIEATVKNPPIVSELEFVSPARQSIKQGIPIMNTSNQQWNINAQIEGSGCFTCRKSMSIAPDGANEEFFVEFKPTWVGDYEGKLTLTNSQTNETMVFNLHGTGLQPLSEDFVCVDVQARTKIVKRLPVPNDFKNMGTKFIVESDLPCVSGNSSINVDYGHVGEYAVTIAPLAGGVYSGSITFSLGEGKPYIWYTVEVRSKSPEPEASLEISSFVRKAVALEITLTNPLDSVVTFDVSLAGAGLLGDATFILDPKQTGCYELVYSPLVAGQNKGSISFTSDQCGEIWYSLDLTALQNDPVKLDPMECSIGKTSAAFVMLNNPTGSEAEIRQIQISNPLNFTVKENPVVIGPYSSKKVKIEYIPSSIDKTEEATVKFSHPEIGDFVFEVSGQGKLPETMDPIITNTCIGSSESASFAFRNPFPNAIEVQISMDTTNGDFSLLLSKSKQSINGFASFLIPYSFGPKEMRESSATIKVEVLKTGMCFCFPLIGKAESPPHHETFILRTRCREPISQTIELPLVGLGNSHTPEPFTYEVVPNNEEHKAFVQRSLVCTPLKTRISATDNVIPLKMDFIPMKPALVNVDLVIQRSSGGLWRFSVSLISDEPKIDDIIKIQASLGQTSTVSFKLNNLYNASASFECHLTSDSHESLSCFPQSGILTAADEEGTSFYVSYTPTEYTGKDVNGKMVIVTDELQFTYVIKGSIPSYVPPTGTNKVNSKPDRKVLDALNKAQQKRKKRFNTK